MRIMEMRGFDYMKKALLVLLALASLSVLGACSGGSPDPLGKDVISIGVRDDTPGLGFNNGSGAISGYEIDLANAIAGELGKEAELVVVNDDRETYLKDGTVDMVIAAFTVTDERKKSFNFSQPYYTDHLVFVVAPDSGYTATGELDGKKIGVAENTTSQAGIQEAMEEAGINADVMAYGSFNDAVSALKTGGVDALFMDNSIVRGYMGSGGKVLDGKYMPQGYGIATRKDNDAFAQKVEGILEELKNNGGIEEMMARWELSN